MIPPKWQTRSPLHKLIADYAAACVASKPALEMELGDKLCQAIEDLSEYHHKRGYVEGRTSFGSES